MSNEDVTQTAAQAPAVKKLAYLVGQVVATPAPGLNLQRLGFHPSVLA